MASSSITSTVFMLPIPSTCHPTNKSSKLCLQRVNISTSSNSIKKTVQFRVECSLKIKPQAQSVLSNEIRVPSRTDILQDNEMITSPLGVEGRLIKGGLVLQQCFCVRSFEIDPEYRMTTKAIMNYLQEASLNCGKKLGLPLDTSFVITPEMRKMDLVWVFRDMRVEVDQYPFWGDAVQIFHWGYTSGRIGLRFDWTINDINTGETLVRASCLAVMMNKKTRKAIKLPEEVKDEIKAFLTMDAEPIIETHRYSIPQIETMDHIKTGLTPGWNDLDVNYHVNNAKYLDWILESTPESIIYGHELRKINLEFRKECLKHDVIQSLSRVVTTETNNDRGIELEHVLRLESGPEILRARTAWRPKSIRRQICKGNKNIQASF